MRISAFRWTEFHQNRKDPIREIQRFPNLGHNLCENGKQTLHGLYLINYETHFADLQGPICYNDAQNKEMNFIVYYI